eukprot:TRINITY_DN263_c0_g1_i6.p2 TRINITY_DN263_c0_g1~~TRINITY_DN263_c0_g1_i6.p2  ORF type:complete len:298 (+),score=-25.76 TRINITY_DN263_c0_g1_i6:642-1535(+)
MLAETRLGPYLLGVPRSSTDFFEQSLPYRPNREQLFAIFCSTPRGFHFASPLGPGGIVTGLVGTQSYMAPEINSGSYSGPAADAFALGILLFCLAVKRLPFKRAQPTDPLYSRIAAGDYAGYWNLVLTTPPTFPITNDFKNLVISLFLPTPAARMTAAGALASQWVTNTPKPSDNDAKTILRGFLHQLNHNELIFQFYIPIQNIQMWLFSNTRTHSQGSILWSNNKNVLLIAQLQFRLQTHNINTISKSICLQKRVSGLIYLLLLNLSPCFLLRLLLLQPINFTSQNLPNMQPYFKS